MRNFIILLALCMSAFTVAQDQGQWSFGIGSNFTSTNDVTANAGYFVMDGLMVSLEFEMATESWDDMEDDYTNWGIGVRYYIGENNDIFDIIRTTSALRDHRSGTRLTVYREPVDGLPG